MYKKHAIDETHTHQQNKVYVYLSAQVGLLGFTSMSLLS